MERSGGFCISEILVAGLIDSQSAQDGFVHASALTVNASLLLELKLTLPFEIKGGGCQSYQVWEDTVWLSGRQEPRIVALLLPAASNKMRQNENRLKVCGMTARGATIHAPSHSINIITNWSYQLGRP